jgi:tetratricopeptide (TPR) repeat protein
VNRKKAANPSTMLRQTALIMAAAAFIMGFLTGVGFTIYKTGSSSNVTPIQGQSVDFAQQARALEAELSKNLQNTGAWIQLGHTYFDADQYEKAIHAYNKALELNPNNADVLTDLGIMYRRSGKPKEAVKSFEKAILVDPKHENSRLNKGIVLMHDLNDKSGAIRAWEELLAVNPFAMVGKDQMLAQLVQHYKEHLKDASN